MRKLSAVAATVMAVGVLVGSTGLANAVEKTGTPGTDFLDGTSADDTLRGLGGGDQLNGFQGNDLIYAGTGGDGVNAGSGEDVVWGGRGHDTLDGKAGKDILYGGPGFDVIEGGLHRDLMYGQGGDDTIVVSNTAKDEGVDYVSCGAGYDTVYVSRHYDDTLEDDCEDIQFVN